MCGSADNKTCGQSQKENPIRKDGVFFFVGELLHGRTPLLRRRGRLCPPAVTRKHPAIPSVGGDAHIAPPRPQARNPLPPSARRPFKASLCEGGGAKRRRERRYTPAPYRRRIPAAACSHAALRTVYRGHVRYFLSFRGRIAPVGIRSLFYASGGLFSFNSERKEEKKRRQKLRFWISLRAFTHRLSC